MVDSVPSNGGRIPDVGRYGATASLRRPTALRSYIADKRTQTQRPQPEARPAPSPHPNLTPDPGPLRVHAALHPANFAAAAGSAGSLSDTPAARPGRE